MVKQHSKSFGKKIKEEPTQTNCRDNSAVKHALQSDKNNNYLYMAVHLSLSL